MKRNLSFPLSFPLRLAALAVLSALAFTHAGGAYAQSQISASSVTAATLGSSLNPSILGQSITLTATIHRTAGGGTPAGSATFLDGATPLGTVALSGGSATLIKSALTAGTHKLTASYDGYAGDSPSTSPALTQVVNTITTTTALSSSSNPSILGQSITLTATVRRTAGPTPTGSVTFLDGTTPLGTVALSGGSATLVKSALVTGTHKLTASYDGYASDAPSTSPALVQVVRPNVTAATLVSSLNPTTFSQSLTFTATVRRTVGGGTPAGSVTFLDGATPLGTVVLSGGSATLVKSALAAGTHELTASYDGYASDAPSTSSALAQVVHAIATITTLNSSGNSALNAAVTLTATVTRQSAVPPWLAGPVTFLEGTTPLGTIALTAGRATLITNALTAGTHTLTATYGGDAVDAPSASAPLSETTATTGVMPLGDSITWGANALPNGGYRGPLWQMTAGQGWDMQFVGSVYAGPPQIGGCEGHGGWTIQQIQGIVPTVLPEFQPKIVLLQIGTNNTFLDGGQSALAQMTALLDALRETSPGTLVFVASLTPNLMTGPSAQGQAVFNQTLPALVQTEVSEGGQFQFVDMHTLCGFGAGDLCSDGTHPTPSGYQKMANVWDSVLAGQSSIAHSAGQ